VNRIIILVAAILSAVPAAAQFDFELTLLGTSSTAPRTSREPARPPITPANREDVTALARFVAAELGRDEEAPVEVRAAVAAAAVNWLKMFGPVQYERGFSAALAERIRERYPRLLAEGYAGADGLSTRNLEWLETHGYALSIEAARRVVLEHQDLSGGAVIWSDMFGADELPAIERQWKRTGSLPTRRGDVVFHTTRPWLR
jgi:hypothetical protein